MANDFHLDNVAREVLLDEVRASGSVDGELWQLACHDFVAWLIRPN